MLSSEIVYCLFGNRVVVDPPDADFDIPMRIGDEHGDGRWIHMTRNQTLELIEVLGQMVSIADERRAVSGEA